jgi:hypothetical protein
MREARWSSFPCPSKKLSGSCFALWFELSLAGLASSDSSARGSANIIIDSISLSYLYAAGSRFLFRFVLLLHRAHKRADYSDLLSDVLVKVETVLFGRAKLHKVVIERFLADLDLSGSLFKRHLYDDSVFLIASVEKPPETHLLNNFLDGALLDARLALLLFLVTFRFGVVLCKNKNVSKLVTVD